MVSFTAVLLLAGAVMPAQAQDFSDLVGTWSSKSNSTFTGDVRQSFIVVCLKGANSTRASTTPSTTISPSPSTRASATRSPPTDTSRSHTTALLQTVRPHPSVPSSTQRSTCTTREAQSQQATSVNTPQPQIPNAPRA